MDASKLETFQLSINKQNETSLTASLHAKAKPSVTDVPALLMELRGQILSDPAFAGFTLMPDREDLEPNLSKKTIRASWQFHAPPQKGPKG